MTITFLHDDFTGTTGDTLATHVPATGGAWVSENIPFVWDLTLADYVLDGAGNVHLVNNSGSSAGSSFLHAGTHPGSNSDFWIEIVATVTDINHGGNGAVIDIYAYTSPSGYGWWMSLQAQHSFGSMQVYGNFDRPGEIWSSANVGAAVSYGVPHTYRMTISSDQMTGALAIDGVTVASYTASAAPPSPTWFGLQWGDPFFDRWSIDSIDGQASFLASGFWTNFVETTEVDA